MRRGLLGIGAAVAALAIALAPAAGASAHDYLVSSDPAAGSTISAPLDTVKLTFNDRVLDLSGNGSSTLLTVTGPGGKHFETGCATVSDRDVTAPVALGGAGGYTITYQVVSADGHTVSSSLAFTYQPAAGTHEAAGSTSPGCKGAAPESAASSPASTASTAPASSQSAAAAGGPDLGVVIGIAIAIVVLAVAGVVIVILTSRRRRPDGVDGSAPELPEDGLTHDD